VTVVPPAATATVHGLVLHPGPERVAADPVCDVAVTVTCVPRGIDAEHVGPQLRLPPPAQVAVTVPAPFPPLLMLKLAFSEVPRFLGPASAPRSECRSLV
jgi:hypothetical protein